MHLEGLLERGFSPAFSRRRFSQNALASRCIQAFSTCCPASLGHLPRVSNVGKVAKNEAVCHLSAGCEKFIGKTFRLLDRQGYPGTRVP